MTIREPQYAFEDMQEGLKLSFGPHVMSRQEIIEFASEYDPQPFHMDEEAGKNSVLGGLAASGWHTMAVVMRMICDAFINKSTSQGAPGIEFNRWKRPVLAGDTLSGTTTVVAARRSKSMPHIGLVTLRHSVVNQRGEVVCEFQHPAMMKLRHPEANEVSQ